MNRSAKCGTGFFFKLQKYLHNEKLNEKIKQIKMIFVFFLGFDEAVIEHTVSKLTRKMNRKYKKKTTTINMMSNRKCSIFLIHIEHSQW